MKDLENYIKNRCGELTYDTLKTVIKNAQQGEKIYLGREYFQLYEKKSEDWIKKEMEEIYNVIASSEEKFFNPEEKKNLYKIFSFYIKYETIFNGKAKYNLIYNLFEKNYSKDLDYALGILETLGNTSEEIFEYYRGLQLLLKKLISEILNNGKKLEVSKELNKESLLKLAYVILKGTELGFLDEDYIVLGEESYKRYLSE